MDDMPKVQRLEEGKYYITFEIPFETDIFVGLCRYHNVKNRENPDTFLRSAIGHIEIETNKHFLWNVLIPQIRSIIKSVKNYIYVEYLMEKGDDRQLLEKIINEIPNILIGTYELKNIIYT